jgi:hypothetical protein
MIRQKDLTNLYNFDSTKIPFEKIEKLKLGIEKATDLHSAVAFSGQVSVKITGPVSISNWSSLGGDESHAAAS